MDALSLLEVKPAPQKKQDVHVKVKSVLPDPIKEEPKTVAPDVVLEIRKQVDTRPDVKVVDKRSDMPAFDRNAFKRRIKGVVRVKSDVFADPVVDPVVDAVPKPPAPSEDLEKRPDDSVILPPLSTEGAPAPKKRGRKKKGKIKLDVVKSVPLSDIEVKSMMLGDTIVKERVGKTTTEIIKYPRYYLENRQLFLQSIPMMFEDYRRSIIDEKASDVSCDATFGSFTLLTHQKIIRDYLSVYSPYRGLLLYHGLGSGKTCSSIAIAEGLKTTKEIIVMTPASLRMNYLKELKFCGDFIYKKKQFWEFVRVDKDSKEAKALSQILNIEIEYINRNKPSLGSGAWMVNVQKEPNYDSLTTTDRKSLDEQIDLMINAKYSFINYNGIRSEHLRRLKKEKGPNPFSNKVVIVDEAHNFVSRIVNKLKGRESLSTELYRLLKEAEDCKIVFLTGTPIINYPNEIAVLFNILRGNIKEIHIPVLVSSSKKMAESDVQTLLYNELKTVDTVKYNVDRKEVVITRNPFGFVRFTDTSKRKTKLVGGVKRDKRSGNISTESFIKKACDILTANGLKANHKGVTVASYTSLPDKLDTFRAHFITEDGRMKNKNKFKRRIVGLTSYFRSAQESLMPAYDSVKNFHELSIEMSDYQLGVYEEARVSERKLEKSSKKKRGPAKGKDIYEDSVSTYRIFSRAFCNFVFPDKIGRPYPNKSMDIEDSLTTLDEDSLDNISVTQRLENIDGRFTADQETELSRMQDKTTDTTYDERINTALTQLSEGAAEYLSPEGLAIYSPKFLTMLTNLTNPDYIGNHLIYSQFRTIEGIGVLRLVLLANGFAEFKLQNSSDGWSIVKNPEDAGKPRFVLYTGTETIEEKEIIRNVFNNNWHDIPTNIREEIEKENPNNNLGEIIKVFMITAAGAEGIDLKNVRFVHLTEPYWHPVRLQQVIGRARRICSHERLPKELRTIDVFLYLMTFSPRQIAEKCSVELKTNDLSKEKSMTPLTSDEALNEISNRKQDINKQLLHSIKEAAIDCSIYTSGGDNPEELECLTFTTESPESLTFKPSLGEDDSDVVAEMNVKEVELKAVKIRINGTSYAFVKETGQLYDYDSYVRVLKEKKGKPLLIGTLETDPLTKRQKIKKL